MQKHFKYVVMNAILHQGACYNFLEKTSLLDLTKISMAHLSFLDSLLNQDKKYNEQNDIHNLAPCYFNRNEVLRNASESFLHKQQTPLQFTLNIILSSKKLEDIVTDSFGRTATTLIALERLNSSFVGKKLDEKNVKRGKKLHRKHMEQLFKGQKKISLYNKLEIF